MNITQLDEQQYVRILSWRSMVITNLLCLWPVACIVASLAIIAILNGKAPWTVSQIALALIAMIAIVFATFRTLFNVGWEANRYLERRAHDIISRRPDRVVDPMNPDRVFVEVVPRKNWNQPKLEDAADVGFFRIDRGERRVLFEGGSERWIIRAADIISCHFEKFMASQFMPRFMIVLGIDKGDSSVVEKCFSPRYSSGIFGNRKRKERAQAIVRDIENMRTGG